MPKFDNLNFDLTPSGQSLKSTCGARATSTYWLLHEYEDTSSSPSVQHRLYLSNISGYNGTPVWTQNCYWDGTQWNRDASDNATRVIYPSSGTPNKNIRIETYPSASAAPWADGSWTITATFGSDGTLNGILQLYSNFTYGGTPQANTLYANTIPKAWGRLHMTAGSPTVMQGFGFGGTGYSGSPSAAFNMSNAMTAVDDYVVVANTNFLGDVVSFTHSTTNFIYFDVYRTSTSTHLDLNGANTYLDFMVLGQQ